jgi:hypothetical protein
MSGCTQPTITNVGFAHLRGIHTLNMSGCTQPSITGLAFEPLIGIRELVCRNGEHVTYSYPSKASGGAPPLEFVMPVGGAGKPEFGPCIKGPLCFWRAANPMALVANVSGLRDLTDADFVHFRGIRALSMSWCKQPTITDAAFVNLRGIHTLDMSNCTQRTITAAAFANLHGIHTLGMAFCPKALRAAARARGLPVKN